jgi:hypothetical protein
MSDLDRLVQEVRSARQRYLALVRPLTRAQSLFRPEPGAWSAAENTEHLVRAEHGGIYAMWRAIEGAEAGEPTWDGAVPHAGKSIERIVAETWKEKEDVPPPAAPVWEGAPRYWISALESNDALLDELAGALAAHDLESIHYPHPISGPLDMRQRLEFLRFHVDRHRGQVEAITRHPDFPAAAEMEPAPRPA